MKWIVARRWNLPSQQLFLLYQLAGHENGTIYLLSSEYIFVYDPISPNCVSSIALGKFASRSICCVGDTLYLCLIKEHKIAKYDLKTNELSLVIGKTMKLDANTFDLRYEDSTFAHPQYIQATLDGSLYICEITKIRKLDFCSEEVTTIAGSGHHEHKEGPAKQASFNNIQGMVITEDNTIYVADERNHSVRQIKNGIVSTVAGNANEFKIRNGTFAEARFQFPSSLAWDRLQQCLFVLDQSGKIRVMDFKTCKVSSMKNLPFIFSIANDAHGNCLATTRDCVVLLVNSWKYEKYFWLARLKEDSVTCFMARVPVEIIRIILSFL